jgi:hypothetical protein
MGAVSTSGTGSTVEIRPSRTWYVVAALIFVGSLIPAFFLARSGIQTIDLTIDTISGDSIEIHDEQLSVFAPPQVSSPGLITCTITTPDGQSIPLDESFDDLSLDGRERVGRTPDGLSEGTYGLRCSDGSGAIAVDGFGVRSTQGWTEAFLKIGAAALLPGIAGLVAITIAVVTGVRRSSARRRALEPTNPPGPPPHPGYPPPAP